MTKNTSASAKKASATKKVTPTQEQIVVLKDFELGKGSKKRSWKKGELFKIPHGWTRNLHQESVVNPNTQAMCFSEVLEEKENEDGITEVITECTHVVPLGTPEDYELLKARNNE